MNAKKVMAGVLIEIPQPIVEIYEKLAVVTGMEFLEVAAQDINGIYSRFNAEHRGIKDDQTNSGTGSEASKVS